MSGAAAGFEDQMTSRRDGGGGGARTHELVPIMSTRSHLAALTRRFAPPSPAGRERALKVQLFCFN